MKFGKWRTEYTVTLLILFAISLVFMPTSIKSTVQANLITKWTDCYKKLIYAHDAILKQEQSEILTSFRRANTPEKREDLIIELLKPYFRLSEAKTPRNYKIKYMNRSFVGEEDNLHMDEYYYTNNNIIVGIKDVPDEKDKDTKFIMTFDVNGKLPPNIWGKDVFGIAVYGKKIEPLGGNMRIEEQGIDCSPVGTGVSCSNYYLVGGGFND